MINFFIPDIQYFLQNHRIIINFIFILDRMKRVPQLIRRFTQSRNDLRRILCSGKKIANDHFLTRI